MIVMAAITATNLWGLIIAPATRAKVSHRNCVQNTVTPLNVPRLHRYDWSTRSVICKSGHLPLSSPPDILVTPRGCSPKLRSSTPKPLAPQVLAKHVSLGSALSVRETHILRHPSA